MRDTKDIIIAWRNTKAAARVGRDLGYSSHSTIADQKTSFDFRQYLNEVEMKAVNKAVRELERDNLEHYYIFNAFYLDKISCARQARVLGKRTDTMVGKLREAENFIRGYIYPVFSGNVSIIGHFSDVD